MNEKMRRKRNQSGMDGGLSPNKERLRSNAESSIEQTWNPLGISWVPYGRPPSAGIQRR